MVVDTPPPGPEPGSGGVTSDRVTVRGRVVVDGSDDEPVTSFIVAVLRERIDNSYYEPDLHEIESPDGTFEITGLRPQRGQIVFHAHFHVIPRSGEAGLGIGWGAGKLENADAQTLLTAMHASLASENA